MGNAEQGVVIESPALARAFITWIESDRFNSVYQVRLQPDGQTIESAHLKEDGRITTTDDEPASGWWLRLKLRLLSLPVDEWDL